MVRHLLKLWCYAAEHKQNGTLSNMEDLDISLAADYDGDDFVLKVIDAGFIDDVFPRKLHDWKDHQGWIVKAPKRKAQAKRAAAISWESRRKRQKQPSADSKATSKAKPHNQQSSFPTPSPSSPLPTLPLLSSLKEGELANADHKMAIEYFCRGYEDKIGVKYAFKGGRDGKLISGLLKQWGLEKLKFLIDTMFTSTDEFYRTKGGYTIGVLSANENRLVQEAKRKYDGTDKLNEAGAATARAFANIEEKPCKPLLE